MWIYRGRGHGVCLRACREDREGQDDERDDAADTGDEQCAKTLGRGVVGLWVVMLERLRAGVLSLWPVAEIRVPRHGDAREECR
jgi:hypothetical protein